ncbi:MAG: DUF3108 domain-containing protein [Tidjanibacter sp.]|nr:DUF3108 domain-containing protein [Tidjanibacter sp.]
MKTRMNLIFATVMLLAAGVMAQAQNSAKEPIYNDGERLEYIISYNASVWPRTDMGEVVFATKAENYNNVPTYKISADASTNNFFSFFYRLDDHFHTYVDQKTLRPLAHECEKKEGNWHFGSKIDFDWRTLTASTWWKNFKRTTDNTKTLSLSPQSMDPICYFYKIRSQDFSTWKDGDEQTIEIVLEDTVQQIKYRLLNREEVTIPKYKPIKALKFSCQLSRSISEDGKSRDNFYIWISDDPNKIPVLVEAPTKIGKIKARLNRMSGLKHENTNILK